MGSKPARRQTNRTVTKDGVWHWNEQNNMLLPLSNVDIRGLTQDRNFVSVIPVMLFYIADFDKMTRAQEEEMLYISWTDNGFIAQNVYLHCASEGLATVVMGAIERDTIRKALKLNKNFHIVYCQAVGHPVD